MKIAITGGSGGFGRLVTPGALAAGHSVVSIDRETIDPITAPGLAYVQADLSDYDAVVAALEGCDALIHLAAIPSPGRHPDHVVHNNNVVASYNALRGAVQVGIRRIAQASSVNAIGQAFSTKPRYDYFPIDEAHPNHAEDPYSLSKWICEQQADALVRGHDDLTIASLRFHWIKSRADVRRIYDGNATNFWRYLGAYTDPESAVQSCLLAITAPFKGHEVFYIVAPETVEPIPTLDLAARHFPGVPITGDLGGHRSFMTSAKAERLLGWTHHDHPSE
jgi:nucleoside-diphosphate-sugar epimerase